MMRKKMEERKIDEIFDSIVIGAGHAGCEAALALARTGNKTLLLTISLDAIAFLACNPSIGGTAKGQLVSEVDALGGEMGIIADKTAIQIRMLNSGKGPAVQSLRAQADKNAYHTEMKKTLENEKNLYVRQGEAVDIFVESGNKFVKTSVGLIYQANSIVFATGVYLKSEIIIGKTREYVGPNGFKNSSRLSDSLKNLGIKLLRFKTGTPVRLHARSINYQEMEVQKGDDDIFSFSYMTDKPIKNKTVCYLTYTTPTTHEIIKSNLDKAPAISGEIKGIGPRYCPSIETKVVRFADKQRHQLFWSLKHLTHKRCICKVLAHPCRQKFKKRWFTQLLDLRVPKLCVMLMQLNMIALNQLNLSQRWNLKALKDCFSLDR